MTTSAEHPDIAAQTHPVQVSYPETTDGEPLIAVFECVTDSDWIVAGDVTRGPFGLVITRLEIRRPGDSTGVTSSLLRKIPVGEILTATQTQVAAELIRRGRGSEQVAAALAIADAEPARTSGRAPLSPQLLREVALAYIAENGPGKGSGAMTRLADKFGKPEETVRRWVARARKDGWLGPGAKGRAGAEPGPKLIAYAFDEGTSVPDGTPEPRLVERATPDAAATSALNLLLAQWQTLADDDPAKPELESEIKAALVRGDTA